MSILVMILLSEANRHSLQSRPRHAALRAILTSLKIGFRTVGILALGMQRPGGRRLPKKERGTRRLRVFVGGEEGASSDHDHHRGWSQYNWVVILFSLTVVSSCS
ncbi:hypothetical protein BDZ91DRAFT_745761 [Kalaharituber pfeilii]|nr:hypothetical protein BDZ91DRAFT_745761 [Kalaharituber pfeilii]